MEKYLIGKKLGMSQVFDKTGKVIPVTIVEIPTHRVTQIKTVEIDGYNAVQVGVMEEKKHLITKPEEGHAK